MARKTTLINRLPKKLDTQKRASQLVTRTALQVEAKWKANVVEMGAVDTGNYLNSVQVVIINPLRSEVGSPVEYSPHIEYGTSRMAPRPAASQAGNDPQLVKNFQAAMRLILRPH